MLINTIENINTTSEKILPHHFIKGRSNKSNYLLSFWDVTSPMLEPFGNSGRMKIIFFLHTNV